MNKTPFIIFTTRVLGMGLKTIFIFYAANQLPLEDFGGLALVNTSLTLLIGFMGLEFHNYTSREIVASPSPISAIVQHFQVTSLAGLIAILTLPFFEYFGALPTGYMIPLAIIFFTEHISTECYRVLIPLNKPVLANCIHFLRTCTSTLVPIGYLLFSGNFTLRGLIYSWAIGYGVLLLGATSLFIKKEYFDFTLIMKKPLRPIFRSITLFLGISLLSRTLFTFDKYLVGHIDGTEVVGIYAFFYSLAFTIQTLIETSLINPNLHEMLTTTNIVQTYKRLIGKVLGACVLLCSSMFLGRVIILKILKKEAFLENIQLLYLLMVSASFFCLALASALPLYSLKKDRMILLSHASAVGVFVVMNFFFHNNAYDVAKNMALSYATLFLVMLSCFGMTNKKELRC